MKRAKRIWMYILTTAAIFCGGLGIYSTTNLQAGADEAADLWDGFAITGTAVRTDDPVGLRFKTDVERLTPTMKKYNPDAEYYTVLKLTTGGKKYTTTRYADVWRPDGSGWNTVLLGIPESDYATEITAQSFIKLNGKEQAFYQTEPVTISITQTAAAAMSYGATQSYITQYVEDQVSTITLDKTSVSMEEGQTTQLTATTYPVQCMAKWTSSDINIATVDSFGKIKAKSVGTATITAEVDGKTTTCSVTVSSKNPTITLSSGNISGGSSASISSGACDVSFARWGDRTITLNGSWLDRVFADERVDAISFMMNSSRATTITTTNNLLNTSLQARSDTNLYFTRAVYEVWKASGTQNFELTSDISTFYTATVSLKDFQKVWAEDESETLTQAEVGLLKDLIPDYSFNSYQFNFYGYCSMSDGTWREYDAETGEHVEMSSGEDFCNVYRIEEYKDAGMTILFPQGEAILNSNGTFEGSEMQNVLDMALEAGLDKVLVYDSRLSNLITTESIVGEGKQFATQRDLEEHVKQLMDEYMSHPACYGIELIDEPSYTYFKALGEVYRAMKACYPEVYIHCNLRPPTGGNVFGTIFPEPTEEILAKYSNYPDNSSRLPTRFAYYDAYLNMFLDETGADYIMYDHYPLAESETYVSYVAGMQVAANVAKARKVNFHFVSQTLTIDAKEYPNNRILTEADLRWLNNMQLGFGIKQLAYFTYFTYHTNSADKTFVDGGSFITHRGEKTDLYYAMREILAENQAFASTILSFDYQSSATYTAQTCAFDNRNAANCIQGDFEKLESVEINRESALVTELYDKVGKRYMYMVQNLVDPMGESVLALQTAKLTFNEDYEYAIVWKNGEKSVVKLENNTYVVKQNSGEAVYVIPFNPDESNRQDENFIFDAAHGDNCIVFPWINKENTPWS